MSAKQSLPLIKTLVTQIKESNSSTDKSMKHTINTIIWNESKWLLIISQYSIYVSLPHLLLHMIITSLKIISLQLIPLVY